MALLMMTNGVCSNAWRVFFFFFWHRVWVCIFWAVILMDFVDTISSSESGEMFKLILSCFWLNSLNCKCFMFIILCLAAEILRGKVEENSKILKDLLILITFFFLFHPLLSWVPNITQAIRIYTRTHFLNIYIFLINIFFPWDDG